MWGISWERNIIIIKKPDVEHFLDEEEQEILDNIDLQLKQEKETISKLIDSVKSPVELDISTRDINLAKYKAAKNLLK